MALDEQRRSALLRAASDTWGEEVAAALAESIPPAGQDVVTNVDLRLVLAAMDAMDDRSDQRFAAMDARFAAVDARLDAMDVRWSERFAAMDARLDAMDVRWSERLTGMDEHWSQRLDAMDERWSQRLDAMDERWSERLTAMDERWDERSQGMEHRLTATFERGLREAITSQTRVIVVSLLVALVALAGVAFGVGG